jgi:hypothetical protein
MFALIASSLAIFGCAACKSPKKVLLLATGLALGGTVIAQPLSRHITMGESIRGSIAGLTQQDVQAFARQLKQYTGEDFNGRTILRWRCWRMRQRLTYRWPS